MAINHCPLCLEKPRKIDQLTEEVAGLKQKLRCRERQAAEGFFGSSTPSAQVPVKANTPPREPKPKGARPGRQGSGRKRFTDFCGEQVVEAAAEHAICPERGGTLQDTRGETPATFSFEPQVPND
jgi:hypothetical protein